MKKYINNTIVLASFVALGLMSCGEEEQVEYNTRGTLQIADPYVQIQTAVVPFQAGTEKYGISFNLINSVKEVVKVNVYSVFTDAVTRESSERVLLKTFPVTSTTRDLITDSLTYEDFKKGITINGNPLPESDLELSVGSGWVLSFEAVTKNNNLVPLAGEVNVGVLSRFAGLYRVIHSEYYRINAFTAEWDDEIRFIGSINDTVFSHNDYWGHFAWAGLGFNFSINFDNNTIQVPIIINEAIYAGDRPLNCSTQSANFVNVPCEGSNILVPDEITGRHQIHLTYGYFADPGGAAAPGAREFYEILEKVVD